MKAKKTTRSGKKETVYYFALNVATKVLTYALLLAIANFFTLIDYGYASFALTVFTIASMLMFPGFTTILVPVYSKNKDVSSLFYAAGIAAVAFALGTIAIALRYPLVLPFAFCFVFAWITSTARIVMIAEKRFHLMQLTEFLFVFLNIALIVALRSYGDYGIVYAYAASFFVLTVVSAFLERRALLRIASKPAFDWTHIKTYWLKGASVFVLLLSFQYLGRSDSIVLGALSTFENVARYNMASAIVGILSAIAVSISMFLLARGSELGKKQGELVFLRSARIAFALNFVCAIALASLASVLVNALFPKYSGIESFVAILAASTLFYSLYYLYVTYLSARLTPEKALKPILIGMLVNFALDVALIPTFGLLGISVATLAASALAFALCRIPLGRPATAFVFASPLFVLAAFALGTLGLVVLVPAVALMFWSKAFEKSDFNAIRCVFERMIARLASAIR